ncbi:MAG: hypothetical protein RBT61_00215 [Candidatus Kapabacteria bacterium]|jgi:hypothetical protein|nr:hypothetical protein [Candidatus Kapabacteria bacterium]
MAEYTEKAISNKNRDLLLSLLLDAIGYISYMIPFGVFSDFIWAPLSAFLLLKIYKGKAGKTGAVVQFFEELTPGLDFIPTFTITWIYTYIIEKEKR